MIVKTISNLLPCYSFSLTSFFFVEEVFSTKSLTEMTILQHGGISKKNFVIYVNMVSKSLSQQFHPYSILAR